MVREVPWDRGDPWAHGDRAVTCPGAFWAAEARSWAARAVREAQGTAKAAPGVAGRVDLPSFPLAGGRRVQKEGRASPRAAQTSDPRSPVD